MVPFLRWCACLACLWLGVVGSSSEVGAQDSSPGLIGRYESGPHGITRRDRQVAFAWGAESPDLRIDATRFQVTWRGTLITPQPGVFQFPVFAQGRVRLQIDGRVVLDSERTTPGWIAGEPLTLSGEDVPLVLEFTKTEPQATVRLFWSGPGFSLEPLPGRSLESPTDGVGEDRVPRGADLVAALGCRQCHDMGSRFTEAHAPPLTQRGAGLQPGWIERHLSATDAEAPQSRMPNLGLDRQQASDIAAFLATTGAIALPPVPVIDAEEDPVAKGGELIRSVGCLACHTWQTAGPAASEAGRPDERPAFAWGGGSLDRVADKLTPEAIALQLRAPERWNPDHRMPRFELSEQEVAAIVAALTAGSTPSAPATAGDPQRGRILIGTLQCSNCHRVGDEEARRQSPVLRPWKPAELADARSCLTWTDQGPARPRFRLATADREAIIEFLKDQSSGDVEVSGETLLHRRGCLNCHPRDGAGGLQPVIARLLAGTSGAAARGEGWLPPDLTAVGDKLQEDWLSRAVAGEQPRRLPWLNVRMPRFRHSERERKLLVEYFVQYDRIPADGPGAATPLVTVPPEAIAPAEWTRAGIALGGARGFSCVGCHRVGTHQPRGVALSTRGSDLHRIDQRLRPEYFQRWVKGPIRIVPNMEMPAFVRPAPGVLHEQLDHQLGALWHVLSQPKPPPFDTSSVEQELQPVDGGPPGVVRDVFQVGDSLQGVLIPRALAIGFDSQSHLVFDLDAFALRGWWSGAFARQRASGKSWFWEPAGTGLQVIPVGPSGPGTDLRLQWPGQAPVAATWRHGRAGRLRGYRTEKGLLEFDYELTFAIDGSEIQVTVTERVQADRPAEPRQPFRTIQRQFKVRGVPESVQVLIHAVSPANEGGWESHDVRLQPGRVSHEGGVVIRVPCETSPTSTSAVSTSAGGAAAAEKGAETAGTLPEPRVEIDVVPGFEGVKLPLPPAIMPTSMAFLPDGTLAVTSLKGQVYLVRDTNADGLPDRLVLVEEGLAAPFGLLADGSDLLVAHKPEVLRLGDFDAGGRARRRTVVADGWGYTDDYHDWTTGIVRDDAGNLYVGLGSDYAKAGRTTDQGRWRGKILRIGTDGKVTPVGHEFRYPIGLAKNAAGDIFVTDNQGVQNPFNELNHLVDGARYGVPSLFEEPHEGLPQPPAIQIPHPWTRSVNGIFFLSNSAGAAFAGQAVGCEYDTRFLVRMSVERVGDVYQGGIYPLSRPASRMISGTPADTGGEAPTGLTGQRGFLGVLCGAEGPGGEIYIGGIHDSGWNGGANVGEIVQLRRRGELPAGIERISVTPEGFQVQFTQPVDAGKATQTSHYAIAGWTRHWTSGYATPDSGQHRLVVERVQLSADHRTVRLVTAGRQTGHVYEFKLEGLTSAAGEKLWPAVGYYTLHQVPGEPK